MGAYNYVVYRPKKRKDYELSEIEAKYSEKDLSKLILINYVQNYPTLRFFPGRMCNICTKNESNEKFQLSGMLLCEECYKKEKEENFKEMLSIFAERNIRYEGSTILENKLILGNIESSYLKDKLKSLGVTHILMIGYFMTPIYPDDFTYGNFEINDDAHENILQFLIEGIKFIDNSTTCYCHCQLGKSRSASFVIAYIMYKNKIHFSEAFTFVRKKRKLICPNEGFQCQLEDLDIILANYDYDLNKCDEFIKKHLKERDELKKTEKEYIMNKLNELAGKRKYSFLDSDDEDDDDYGKDKIIIGKEEDDNEEDNTDEHNNKGNNDDVVNNESKNEANSTEDNNKNVINNEVNKNENDNNKDCNNNNNVNDDSNNNNDNPKGEIMGNNN